MEQEPVRWTTVVVGVIVGLLAGVVSWSSGADVRAAVGVAAGNVGAFLATGQFLRAKVWSPASHRRELDRVQKRKP